MSTKDVHDLPKWISERIRLALAKQDRGLFRGVGFSGFRDFDQMAGGLWPGDLIVVAGSPDMGKTALALNIAENLAFKETKNAVYFSSDLAADQLAIRTVCSEGRISLDNIRSGKLTDHERERFASAIGNLASGRLHFAWREGLSVNQILGVAAKYSKKCGNLGLVVVDYLQQLCSDDNRPINEFEIAESLRQLKELATEFHCPVIALSQLPLSVEMRWNKRPELSDLGLIEPIRNYVDTVALLYRDEVYTKNDCPEPGIVNLTFPIRRDGSSGQTKMVFLNQIAKFETLACQL